MAGAEGLEPSTNDNFIRITIEAAFPGSFFLMAWKSKKAPEAKPSGAETVRPEQRSRPAAGKAARYSVLKKDMKKRL